MATIRLDSQIELITTTYEADAIGQRVPAPPVYRPVFAKRGPVPRQEFFEAGQQDIRAALMFLVHTSEYRGELALRFGGQEYAIYRTYERDSRMTELYCEVRLGGD